MQQRASDWDCSQRPTSSVKIIAAEKHIQAFNLFQEVIAQEFNFAAFTPTSKDTHTFSKIRDF
jgi:hypothetical protein